MRHFMTLFTTLVLLLVLVTTTHAMNIETVLVGNLNNPADNTGYGSVGHDYSIGMYEITAGQYCEFLNAVAKTDPYGLYNSQMWSHGYGCKIARSGSSGSYSYSVASDRADRPVNYVGFWDAARFANWLHNGQPTGAQDDSTTEDGSYDLNGAINWSGLAGVTRKTDATWVIPTENEWYKAAYHKNDGITGNYFEFPTSSDSIPCNDLTYPDGGNNANFEQGGYTIGGPYYTTEVGEFEFSDSPYGTFDQGGNVWEWNEAFLSSSYTGVRGGHWEFASHTYMAASNRWNSSFYPEYWNIGIRVANADPVPEPGAITLLLCGLAGLVCWRRRK